MIPKIIHYCWFGGGEMPEIATKCIDSWNKHCPDFEIKLWNETNFDINVNKYSMESAKVKQWAFVADIARLWVIYNYGGVYLDIDVEVIRPIDKFLNDQMFLGFESFFYINMGSGFGAEKNFYLLKKMLDSYNKVSFINSDGTLNQIASPSYTTDSMKKEGFIINNTKQIINNVSVYPTEYFCPKDFQTGEITITENTHAIHHFLASWWDEEDKRKLEERHKQYEIRKKILKFHKSKGINIDE